MCLAVPGKIENTTGSDLSRVGIVDFGGVAREVNLACVPEAGTGDFVLVHAGLAIARIDREEAARLIADLESLEEPMPPGGGTGEDS